MSSRRAVFSLCAQCAARLTSVVLGWAGTECRRSDGGAAGRCQSEGIRHIATPAAAARRRAATAAPPLHMAPPKAAVAAAAAPPARPAAEAAERPAALPRAAAAKGRCGSPLGPTAAEHPGPCRRVRPLHDRFQKQRASLRSLCCGAFQAEAWARGLPTKSRACSMYCCCATSCHGKHC